MVGTPETPRAPAGAPATRRLFVALNPDEASRAALHAAAGPLRALLGPAVAWTPAVTLHLTVRFLGEQPDACVAPLVRALGAAARAAAPLVLAATAVGAFPSLERPRVLWIGLAPDAALDALARAVDDACAALGLGREPRAFHPHLTIGRVRPGRRDRAALAALGADALRAAAAQVHARRALPIATLDLMASQLAASGARHVRLDALPLGHRVLPAAPLVP